MNEYVPDSDYCDACQFDFLNPALSDIQLRLLEEEVCPGCGRDLVTGKLAVLRENYELAKDMT